MVSKKVPGYIYVSVREGDIRLALNDFLRKEGGVKLMTYVYHGSPTCGLKYIEPRMSTHGKEYVYATKDKVLAVAFLQKHNDYLINISYTDDGILELTERVAGAFIEIFKGKSGYLYYLNSINFLEGQTSFSEVVSEVKEQVIYCETITCSYMKLQEMALNNQIVLFAYPNRPDYIPKDDSDLIHKTKFFIEQSNDKDEIIQYAINKHPHLKNEIMKLLSK